MRGRIALQTLRAKLLQSPIEFRDAWVRGRSRVALHSYRCVFSNCFLTSAFS